MAGWRDKIVSGQAPSAGWRNKIVASEAAPQEAPPQPPESRPVQAGIEGFGQTATGGYLPQLQALAEKPMARVGDLATGANTVGDESTWEKAMRTASAVINPATLLSGVMDSDYVKNRDENIARQRQLADTNPWATNIGKGAGIAASMLMPGEAPSSVWQAMRQGGLLGAAYNPGDTEGELSPIQAQDRALHGLFGAGMGAAGYGAAKALKNVGDRAMQWSVGRKKYTPDVGTELADQGVWGTKGMMRGQVQDRLGKVGQEMSSVADDIGPVIDAKRIGDEILSEETGRLTGGGINAPRQRDMPLVDKISEFSNDIASGGMETGQQALARRGVAGSSAFSQKSQEPLQNQMARLSKLEQQKYSAALKSADPRMAPLDKTYGALKRAELPLNQEETISGFGGLASSMGKAVARPIASTIGQAGTKFGRAAQALTPTSLEMFLEGLRKK